MNGDWNTYLNHNSPEQMDCQLVTAVNAYYYLTGNVIRQRSTKYNNYIKLSGAIAGPCTSAEKVHDKLGIEYAKQDKEYGFPSELPFEIHLWHKSYGFHSALVIDHEPITNSYRIVNFEKATNSKGWIYAEDLMHYWRLNPDNSEPRHRTRVFVLKPLKLKKLY